MKLKLRRARAEEFLMVRDFYYELIDEMQNAEYHPKWQKGIYPEDEYLRLSCENGTMFLAERNGAVVGAMIFNTVPNDGYGEGGWLCDAAPGEYGVIHALGVMPRESRQGVGKFLVNGAVEEAEKQGLRSIRLDVLEGNVPASKLYLSCGFTYLRTSELFYEDTGYCNFELYEYLTGEKNYDRT